MQLDEQHGKVEKQQGNAAFFAIFFFALLLSCFVSRSRARKRETAKKARAPTSANDKSTETSHPNLQKGPLRQRREKFTY
jgi:hypothetical protein